MATATVEDYVKAIYAIQRESPTEEASVARIAAILGVTKGTVTAMVRKLREARLVRAQRYGGVKLTQRGTRLALDVIRRHRIIEVFLVDVLEFDWSEVHEEAERLEHAMSAKLLDRLDAYLGHPAIDPHGDPIPDADGHLDEPDTMALHGLPVGDEATIVRVSDQDPKFLEFASQHGLRPGRTVRLIDAVPEAESITVRSGRRNAVTMSVAAAGKIQVTGGRAEQRRTRTKV